MHATSQPIVRLEIVQISRERIDLRCKSSSFVLPLRLPLRAFGPSFRRGTAGEMLARARCDETKHSRAVARLSIAVGRRLQARAALPEAGRPRRKASRPVATWRLVDLTTWTKSAGRRVDKSKDRDTGDWPRGSVTIPNGGRSTSQHHDRIDRRSGRPEGAERRGAEPRSGEKRRMPPATESRGGILARPVRS